MNILEDPLDSDSFDPVQYINQKFPTEASLGDLDTFILGLGTQISALDEIAKEISKAIQTQSVVGKQASKDIVEAQKSIEELFEKIGEIKEKAEKSENMVQDICADIKKLDYAKNHLQTSITALNRLQMLNSAVQQLEILSEHNQYREIANLLDAVKQFMSHFEKYVHIQMIGDIQKRIERIRAKLTSDVSNTFRHVAKAVESVADADLILSDLPGGTKSIADVCLVVDSLGPKVRQQLLEEFVQMQLVPYEGNFGMGKPHYNLDDVERRWAWFRRLLKHIDAKFHTIFPQHWRLPLRLCLEFTERTKIHLVTLLTDMESRDTNDVHSLLKALQSALRFEQEMSQRFQLLQEIQQVKEKYEAEQRRQEEVNQQRLKNNNKLMYLPTDHQSINHLDETESGFLNLAHAAIGGGISGVFDKFLGSYVIMERRNLEEMLQKLSLEEDVTSSEGGAATSHGNVYGSSTNMFVFIKNSIKRCTALTTGQTFLSLSKEFKTCMQQYVEMLRNRCPPATGQPPVHRLAPGQEVSICYLLNTGEYCAEVVPQLEQMIQQKMNPLLATKVDFSSETDAYMDLVAYCLKVLISGVLDRLDPCFRTMQAHNWATTTQQVGDESQYLHMCNAVLVEAIPKIRDSLTSSYFNNYCTKLATEILQRYLDIIVKQKKISDMATQQLLLDTYQLKTLLLQLHNLDHPDVTAANAASRPNIPTMYTKLVNGKVGHIEMILKLVATPEELLLERFRIMWPEGTPQDLQLLMSLKGTKRNDQQVILEMLGLSAASKLLNKTTNMFHGAGSGQGSNVNTPTHPPSGPSTGTASSALSAATSAAASSMKTFTQDISSMGRNAVGNLKWSSKNKE